MITKVKHWFLQIVGKTAIPLLERVLNVAHTIHGVLKYVLNEIVSEKLEIPENTAITDALNSALFAVSAIIRGVTSALKFMGVDVPTITYSHSANPVISSRTAIEQLKQSTDELNALVNKLEK